MLVLALNSGSSSLKFGLYRVDGGATGIVYDGEVDAIGTPEGRLRIADGDGRSLLDEAAMRPGQRDAVARIAAFVGASGFGWPDAIGHRVVHGGPALRDHCVVDAGTLRDLDAANAFAPLHGPRSLELIRLAIDRFPAQPQVVCFDTAFHATLDERARVLAIPRALRDEGIERYGFHGLSCESIVEQLATRLPERVVIAHLGSGASVTAVKDGRSIDTSMGLTPSGGVIMGTRSGDLDPGVLLWLMREKRLDAPALERLIDQQSGLLGISDVSGDMRALRRSAAKDAGARLAIDMFCHEVATRIAAMIVALDGADLLVFTGGIGEHDADARAAIVARLRWFGLALDDARNRSLTNPLQTSASRCAIEVLPSAEDARIAHHTARLVSATGERRPATDV